MCAQRRTEKWSCIVFSTTPRETSSQTTSARSSPIPQSTSGTCRARFLRCVQPATMSTKASVASASFTFMRRGSIARRLPGTSSGLESGPSAARWGARVSTEPDPKSPAAAPDSGKDTGHGTVADVEAAIDAAIAERDAEFSVVQRELSDLSATYDRLRIDLDAMAKERDSALSAVREERERRARERLELSERLEEAKEREDSQRRVDASALRERFVAERLAAAPPERHKLPEGSLPKIDGYEVLARVGRGGMATVFRARRTEDGVEVALKLLQDGADAGRSRSELFLREAAV